MVNITRIRILLVYLFLLLVISCSTESPSTKSSQENIKLKNISELNISDIVDSIHTVILENYNEIILGDIDKIRIVDSIIYIGDFSSNVITAFNWDGSYRFNIDHIGQGPGEYAAIKSFAVDNKYLYVIDNWTGKLIKYDATNGNYLNDIKMPFVAWDIEVIDSNKLLFTYVPMPGANLLNKQPPYRLFITDLELNIKEKMLEFSFDNPDIIGQKLYFTEYNKNIVFGSLFFDGFTIIDKETNNLRTINIDFDNSLIKQNNINLHDINKYQFLTAPPFMCNHYIYMSINDNGLIKDCLYDTQTKNLLYNSHKHAKNFFLPIIGTTNDYFIATLSEIDVYQNLKKYGFNISDSTKIEKALDKEGTVLFFYKLK